MSLHQIRIAYISRLTDWFLKSLKRKVSSGQTSKIITFLDKISKDKIEPYINSCYQNLHSYVNSYAQKMQMGREVIADKGIWTAKKRYILNVYDSEGVKYKEPKLKIMGIESVTQFYARMVSR